MTELPRLKKSEKPCSSGTVWLGIQPDAEVEKLFAGMPEPKEQGYRLAVGKDWVVILGKDLPGLYYGLMTFRQLIEPGGNIPSVKISDWPDLPLRGTYIAEDNPEKKIEYFASLKMNFIVFEYGELYHLDNPVINARWKKIADECRKHFIEPIPELQCFGHGHFVVATEPRCVESVYAHNIAMVVSNGNILPLKETDQSPKVLENAIITDAAPVVVTNKSGDKKYVEGNDYKVIPGDPLLTGDIWTGKPFYPTGRKATSLQVIPGSRISEGDELLLSYNYATPGSLSCCPSEPLYRDLMRKSIHNVVKCMKCNYIHIGHDEPQALNRDSRCMSRGLSNAEIYVDDIKRMREYALEASPKCRIMMWDDTLNPYANAPGLQLEKAAQLLPRDIIMCTWAYGYPGDNERIQKAIDFWTKLGFDITGSPWYNPDNARYWAQSLIEHKDCGHIMGSFYTAWLDDKPRTWGALNDSAKYSWSGNVASKDAQA
ncbi:MAG TPA: glycoside hydrolase family 20 zincin-like fold domain-containing protein, partial [Bacteroidales bacterium]|nr:glycoside hydrolase family 20 zincin-like fold domain-containing protein [Bacteroidales bacterium]